MNCVGFHNHKFFLLLVVYGLLSCTFVSVTIMDSVQRAVTQETAGRERFLLVLGMTLAMIMAFFMMLFLLFHIYLMLKGMTTIEFCEKNTLGAAATMRGKRGSPYDLGFQKNLQAVL